MSKKLTGLTQVTTVGDNSLFFIVDPDRPAGDRSVGMDKDDVQTLVGGGGGTVVPKTGTTIEFTEDAVYNFPNYLTSGDITFNFTNAKFGATSIIWCDRYVPLLPSQAVLTGTLSAAKLNKLVCTYFSNDFVSVTNAPKDYLATPSFSVTPTAERNDITGFAVSGASTYSIKFNTVDNENTAVDVPSYNGTDTSYAHTGLTNGTQYFYYIIASGGQGKLDSATGTGSGTPESAFTFDVQAPDSTFTLPLLSTGTYNFDIYVDDVQGATITAFDQPEVTINLGDTASHKIELRGQIEGWSFSANSEANKIYNLKSWGDLRFSGSTSSSRWFDGCTNLTVTATDSPDFTNSTSGFYAFRGCSSLTTIPSAGSWDLSNFTTLQGMFQNAILFNTNLNGLTTSSLCTNYTSMFQNAEAFNSNLLGLNFTGNVNLASMFRDTLNFNGQLNWAQVGNAVSGAFGLMFNAASAFDQDISAMVFNANTKVTGNFILNNGGAFSQANADLFLVALEAQVAASGGVLDNGSIRIDCNFTNSGAVATAYNNLQNTYGWTLTNFTGV